MASPMRMDDELKSPKDLPYQEIHPSREYPIHDKANTTTVRQRYPAYHLQVDPLQDDRAIEIKLFSFARPHMRSFHYAWLSFFIAFFGWFSIPPLLPMIQTQLGLSSTQVANSNIAAVASTIVGRVVMGPLCDHFGPRVIQSMILLVGAIPVASAALVTNYYGFLIVRFCIGTVGSAFVATTYWTSILFARNVVGSANAFAAGLGGLGAGVTYVLTPLLFTLVTWHDHVSDDLGWRLTLLVPAVAMVIVGICLYYFSDDCPHGNFADLLKRTPANTRVGSDGMSFATESTPQRVLETSSVNVGGALMVVARLPVAWILAFQYACSFGVLVQVQNILSLYYYEEFTHPITQCDPTTDVHKCRILTQTSAALISSLFGLVSLFARAMGGVASDAVSRHRGMQGRLFVQLMALLGQAISLLFFAHARSIGTSVPCLLLFGILVQACTGTTFALVPFVAPQLTGAMSGFVGAGGNVGALLWGFLFKALDTRAEGFDYLSACVGVSALLCFMIRMDNEGSIWSQSTSSTSYTSRSVSSEETRQGVHDIA